MANERGTKRTDPDTGKKFYDLNMDPIVSPYTGKSYPRSFFEQMAGKVSPATARKVDDEDETEEEEVEDVAAPEIVSLEEADAEESGDEIPDVVYRLACAIDHHSRRELLAIVFHQLDLALGDD